MKDEVLEGEEEEGLAMAKLLQGPIKERKGLKCDHPGLRSVVCHTQKIQGKDRDEMFVSHRI